MPTRSFSSFEAFFDANRHANLRAMVLGPDRGNWVLTNVKVNKLSVQFSHADGNAVVEGSPMPGGVSIFILTQGFTAMSGNGQRFDDRTLLIARAGDEFCLAADSPRRWCSLYIPSSELVGANQDATTAVGPMRGVIRLAPERIGSLRSVIRQFDEAVQQAPDAFQSAEAQKAAELKLMREIRNVLAVPSGVEPVHGRHEVPRRQIIRMSMDFVDQHDGEHLSVEQLATSAGVSERTLRDAFRGYFGAAPVQYLNQRTLHLVRRALKAADPSVTTVTNIATQFGVWELGRFARDYFYLFGELPSATLRH